MPVAGAKLKPDGQKVTRVPPVHEWTEVVNVPYAGERPDPGRLPKVTQAWWDDISVMPHCILWTPQDWRFALDTARVHALAFGPKQRYTLFTELRGREKVMGMTADHRRDLRIRYVEPAPEPQPIEGESAIADFEAERRRRLMEDE